MFGVSSLVLNWLMQENSTVAEGIDEKKTFPKKLKNVKKLKKHDKNKKNVCKRWKNHTSVIFRRSDRFEMPRGLT